MGSDQVQQLLQELRELTDKVAAKTSELVQAAADKLAAYNDKTFATEASPAETPAPAPDGEPEPAAAPAGDSTSVAEGGANPAQQDYPEPAAEPVEPDTSTL